ISAGRTIEDGARARVKHSNGVLTVRPFEQNHQRYRIASRAIFGHQFLGWDVRHEDIYAIPIVQFPEGRRLVDHSHDDDGGIVAWQLFEVAAQNGIARENRDADHEGWPAPTADRNYATGRSPMTTRRAVGAPPRINARSTLL